VLIVTGCPRFTFAMSLVLFFLVLKVHIDDH